MPAYFNDAQRQATHLGSKSLSLACAEQGLPSLMCLSCFLTSAPTLFRKDAVKISGLEVLPLTAR